MYMRRRLLLVVPLLLSFGLAGCETSDLMDNVSEKVHDFNPFGTAKKKLPGQRQAVFPNGVPGVQQGVPPELMPGAADTATISEPTATVAEEKKPKPARRRAATAAPAPQKPARAAATRRAPREAAPAPQRTATPARTPGNSPWDSVPTKPVAPAPAAAPPPVAVAPASQAGWAPPASQPVPTQWPDPK
jgi:hypothetical protein